MRKIINEKKGEDILGPEVIKIVLTVIGLVILAMLVKSLYDSFIMGDAELKRATSTVERLAYLANNLDEDNPSFRQIVEFYDWHLVTTEMENWNVCQGAFCLCMCEDRWCEKRMVCKPTNKFVWFKDELGHGLRSIKEKNFFEAEFNYDDEIVYPFNVMSEDLNGILVREDVRRFDPRYRYEFTPLFFRFDFEKGVWEWGNLIGRWNGLDNTRLMISRNPNQDLIEEFNQYTSQIEYPEDVSEERRKEILERRGIEFLNNKGVTESKGVVILQTRT